MKIGDKIITRIPLPNIYAMWENIPVGTPGIIIGSDDMFDFIINVQGMEICVNEHEIELQEL